MGLAQETLERRMEDERKAAMEVFKSFDINFMKKSLT